MNFYSILGFALIVTVLLMLLRKERPEFATLLALAAGAMILIALLKNIQEIMMVFEGMARKAKLETGHLKLIVKIIGLAYLAGFGAQICRDTGEGGMAVKIELAGKVFILALGIPIMLRLLDLMFQFF